MDPEQLSQRRKHLGDCCGSVSFNSTGSGLRFLHSRRCHFGGTKLREAQSVDVSAMSLQTTDEIAGVALSCCVTSLLLLEDLCE